MKELANPRNHIALEASAGTGKTYSLTLRLLNILLEQIDPQASSLPDPHNLAQVVALTFTNKAANEMKERLLKWLHIARNAHLFQDDEQYAPLYELQQDIGILRKRAERLYELLLKHLSVLEICTLDSFLLSILRLFPFELGLRLDVNVANTAQEASLIDEAISRLFIRLQQDDRLNILKDIYRQKLLPRNYQLRNWLKDIFEKFLIHQDFIDPKRWKTASFEELKQAEKDCCEALEVFKTQLQANASKTSEINLLNKLKNCQTVGDLLNIKMFSEKASLKAHRNLKSLPPPCHQAYERLRNTLSRYVITANLYRVGLLYELFQEFYKYFTEIKRRENYITFQDLSSLAYKLLVKDRLFEEKRDFFYYRLDARLKHLLLDEFQDTSLLQWQVLEPLVRELVSGIGTRDLAGSFFYVGDAKQAIYRFRGGEPRLADYVKRQFQGYIKEKSLPINYRSAEGLVNFVNRIGNHLKEKFNFPFKAQKACKANQNVPYYVEFDLIPPEDSQRPLGKRLVDIINQATQAGFNYNEIAILVRKRQAANAFLPVLKENGIPVKTETETLLLQSPAVRTVIALLKYLNQPEERLPLAVFLKAIGIEATQLENLGKNYPELIKTLTDLRNQVDLVPLTALLKRIYESFDLLNRLQDTPNLWELMAVAHEFESHYPRSLQAFLCYLEENSAYLLQAKDSSPQAVQVITIHKAKGLEYPVVILPETTYNCLDNKDKLVFKYQFQSGNFRLDGVFLSPNQTEAALHPELKFVKEYATQRQLEDELNLLYVALTRAKQALFILAQAGHRKLPQHCWANFITEALGLDLTEHTKGLAQPMMIYKEGKLIKPKDKTPPTDKTYPQSKNYGLSIPRIRQLLGNLPRREMELPEESSPQKEQKFGEAFHYAMSFIRHQNDDIEYAINKARSHFGLYLNEDNWQDIRLRIKQLLKNCPQFFNQEQVLNEIPFLVASQGIKAYRADRIILKPNELWVIDYKTGRPEGAHQKQLMTYKDIVKRLYPNRSVKGFLVYVGGEAITIKEV